MFNEIWYNMGIDFDIRLLRYQFRKDRFGRWLINLLVMVLCLIYSKRTGCDVIYLLS
jgi:hypothetical protein